VLDSLFCEGMNYFIITGASQGFGRAVAENLLKGVDNFVIAIARNNPGFSVERCSFIRYDFSDIDHLDDLAGDIFSIISPQPNAIYFVNNAAVVSPIGPLDKCQPKDIVKHININVVSPSIFASSIIRNLKHYNCERGILNISSGAFKKPFYGWSCYCGSKAFVEMTTRCIALENPDFVIASYDPGVIDTAMQTELRSQKEEDFEAVSSFVALKEENKLQTPDEAAERLINIYFLKFVGQRL
jgi:benzil reductase ((S)-benzoin forming)